MTDRKPPRKASRGEWLVVIQVALIALVLFGPRTLPGLPSRPFPFPRVCWIAGDLLMAAGLIMLIAGAVQLGRGLTPLPYPKDTAELVQTGPFALVRHPIYSGGILFALGWALYVQAWPTLFYVAVLFLFLDVKARREEGWLAEKFPAYAEYRKRVHKFIPFVY